MKKDAATSSLIRDKNVVHITKGNATYTIMYGMHVVTQNPEELPEKIDAVFLETGMHRWADDPEKCITDLRGHVQYKALFQKLEKKRIPVLFGDLKYKYNDHALLVADNAFSVMGWMSGMHLAKNALSQIGVIKEEEKETKKKLKIPPAVGLAAGAYLMLPFASSLATLVASTTGQGRGVAASLKKLSHRLHPEAEILYLSMRNAVIAQKEEFFAQKIGKRVHIATVLGAGHVGVEDMLLKSPQQRETYFKRFQPLFKKLAIPEYFSTLTEMTYTGKAWKVGKVYNLPELKHLV